MKLEEGDLIQWKERDAYHTGRVLMFEGEPAYAGRYCTVNLVKHSYTGNIHAVSIFDCRPYPSSPILEPTK